MMGVYKSPGFKSLDIIDKNIMFPFLWEA